jgi:hypothetical protein
MFPKLENTNIIEKELGKCIKSINILQLHFKIKNV